MRIQRQNITVSITGLRELCATNAHEFREQACAAVSPDVTAIEIDLSQIPFIDSCGLGALIALHQAANGGEGNGPVAICLLDPTPAVRQVIELTRMDCVFQMKHSPPVPLEDPLRADDTARPA